MRLTMLPISGILLFLLGLLSNSGGDIHAPSTNLVDGTSPIQVTNQDTAQFNSLTPALVSENYIAYLPVIYQSCPEFLDTFSNPDSGWYVGEISELLVEYQNGEYRWLIKQVDTLILIRAPICKREIYNLEVDARWGGNSGASYGLVFDIEGDYEQFFTFQVNADDQEYALYRYNSYGWVAWQPYTYSWAIHPGTAINHLKVIRDKNGISLHINGVYVSSWYQPQEGEVKGVGLLAGSYSNIPNADARFDNFKVGYFKPLTVNSTVDHAGLVDPAIAWGKGGSQLKNSKDLFQQATGMCLGSICQFNVSGRK